MNRGMKDSPRSSSKNSFLFFPNMLFWKEFLFRLLDHEKNRFDLPWFRWRTKNAKIGERTLHQSFDSKDSFCCLAFTSTLHWQRSPPLILFAILSVIKYANYGADDAQGVWGGRRWCGGCNKKNGHGGHLPQKKTMTQVCLHVSSSTTTFRFRWVMSYNINKPINLGFLTPWPTGPFVAFHTSPGKTHSHKPIVKDQNSVCSNWSAFWGRSYETIQRRVLRKSPLWRWGLLWLISGTAYVCTPRQGPYARSCNPLRERGNWQGGLVNTRHLVSSLCLSSLFSSAGCHCRLPKQLDALPEFVKEPSTRKRPRDSTAPRPRPSPKVSKARTLSGPSSKVSKARSDIRVVVIGMSPPKGKFLPNQKWSICCLSRTIAVVVLSDDIIVLWWHHREVSVVLP